MNIDRPTELRRLARTLHRKPEELDYLKSLDGAGLMKLRTTLQNALLDRFSDTFSKLAAGGKIAPDALSAFLCKKIFGPALTANMSYYTPTAKAAAMCKHFDADFMAEIAREQIPERAEKMLQELPVDLMRAVTRKMVASKDYHIMGGFTDYLPEEKIIQLMAEITDLGDHLRVSRFAQRKDRIASIACKLDDAQIKSQIKAAFTDEEFVLELGLITSLMQARDQQRMAKLTDAVNPEYRKRAAEIAGKAGTRDALKAYFAAWWDPLESTCRHASLSIL